MMTMMVMATDLILSISVNAQNGTDEKYTVSINQSKCKYLTCMGFLHPLPCQLVKLETLSVHL